MVSGEAQRAKTDWFSKSKQHLAKTTSGYAWRSHARARTGKRGVRRSPQGEDGLVEEYSPYLPVNLGGRFSIKLATPSRKSLPASATIISLLASIVASASVWNGTS
ncbi:hypothetical protein AB7M17_001810 [Bradyrhizobium sp. USDA 377]